MSYETILSPNNSPREKEVHGIILHFTAGGDIEGTIQWFKNENAKASAHYIVSRSGRVVQMVREERAAWHAGSGTTIPKLNGEHHLNDWTIGIEICNWGYLYQETIETPVSYKGNTYVRKPGKIYTRMKNWTHEFNGQAWSDYAIKSNVPNINKSNPWPGKNEIKCWEAYSQEQIDSVVKLIKEIVDRYPQITRKWIARHQDVDPTRKLDPGPAFPYAQVMDSVFQETVTYKLDRRVSEEITEEDMISMYEPRNYKPTLCKKLFS